MGANDTIFFLSMLGCFLGSSVFTGVVRSVLSFLVVLSLGSAGALAVVVGFFFFFLLLSVLEEPLLNSVAEVSGVFAKKRDVGRAGENLMSPSDACLKRVGR